MADFVVGEGDDVGRVGVDADEAGDLDEDAGFLLDLADGLADLLGADGVEVERPRDRGWDRRQRQQGD